MTEPTSNNPSRCSRCGGVLAQANSGLFCPRCVARIVFSQDLAAPEELPDSLEAIKQFGNYELIEEIARGGMGVVYRARQLNLGREVAVKLMLHGAFASAAEVDRFRAEATAAASLRHPGIVAIHEIGEHEGQHYFSMDLVPGRNLDDLTRSGPVASRRAAEWVASVARAVDYAHRQGILHRDLKPSNVIIDAEGRPHVTDFGLARRLVDPRGATLTGQILGTPAYMAPEQTSGDPGKVGVASDVYSLGAVLYQTLTGRPPFVGTGPVEVLRQVAEREPVAPSYLNPSVPRDLETIAQKCLNKEPGRRYASASELADDLERFLRNEPIRARPVSAMERLGRWIGRNRTVALLAGVVTLLLVVVAAGASVFAVRLNRARRAEQVQRLEAEKRLRQGEQLIHFMLGDLAERLKPVGRLDLLDSTMDEVGKFYASVPPEAMTADSEFNRADALMQFADIRSLQGRVAEAVAAFEKAVAAHRELVAHHPENLSYRFELTRAEDYFAIVYLQQQDYAKAMPILEQCLREREELVRLAPNNLVWLSALAGTAQNMSVAERRLGHLDRAGELVLRAAQIFRQWCAVDPQNPKPRERLALVCGTAGHYFAKVGRLDEAEKAYREKIGIIEELVRLNPRDLRYQGDHAAGLGLLAEFHASRSRYAEAVGVLDRGIAEADTLVAADPGNREWWQFLVNQLRMRGEDLEALGRTTEGLKDYQRVAEISAAQPEGAAAFGEWMTDLRQSLTRIEAISLELAEAEKKAGRPEAAAPFESAAAAAHAKLAALPEAKDS